MTERISYRSKLSESTEEVRLNNTTIDSPIQTSPFLISKPIPALKKQSQLEPQFDLNKLDQLHLIALNYMKANDEQFQNLLIAEEQLNLQYIEQIAKHKKLNNEMRQLMNPYLKVQNQISKTKASLEAKTNHLRQYHAHLYQKLCAKNTLIFIQQQNLLNRYENELKGLEKTQNKQIQQIEKEIKQTKMQRDINQKKMKLLFHQMSIKQKSAVSINKFGPVQLTKYKKRELMKSKDQSKKLTQQKQSQMKEQKQLGVINQALKYLLTVEDEHNNSCMIIESCLLKKECQKVYEFVNNKIQEKEYQTKIIPDMMSRMKQIKKQNEGMEKKIRNKEKTLENLTLKLTQVLQQFSKLNQ